MDGITGRAIGDLMTAPFSPFDADRPAIPEMSGVTIRSRLCTVAADVLATISRLTAVPNSSAEGPRREERKV